MRIVFAGTPDIAAHILNELILNKYNIVGVFTQPDRPSGRGRKLTPSPVKLVATTNNIPVFQPKSLKNIESQNLLKELNPDLMIVVAYGLILPKPILETPKYGCINVHASILPHLRGAAPIQHAILNGDNQTGITIMQMDEGLDTGDMLYTLTCKIDENETSGSLFEKLTHLGARALLEALELIPDNIVKTKQSDSESTYANKINKEDAHINWNKPAFEIEREIRAYNPHPCCFSFIDSNQNTNNNDALRLKIYFSKVIEDSIIDESIKNGTIIGVSNEGLDIKCQPKALRITELQLPGGKKSTVKEILNSKPNLFQVGNILY